MIDSRSAAAAAELRLRMANEAYFSQEKPIMIDADYDDLKIALANFYKSDPQSQPVDSVLEAVGAPIAAGARQARHLVSMLSLGNAFTSEQVENFCASLGEASLYGELKLDGLSLSLRYEGGLLVRAATRGDGMVGEDVTRRLGRVRGIARQLDGEVWGDVVEIRGEVCMHRDVFAQLNSLMTDKVFSNPRNAAAGVLRRDADMEGAVLDFYVYQVVGPDGFLFDSQSQALATLEAQGFKPAPLHTHLADAQAALEWYEMVGGQRADLPVDIDGVVYKVDRTDIAKKMGARSTAPRWAIAHKFPADKAWTRVRAIDIQIGRTGILAPVARLDPIMVGGVLVGNATLHNRAYIEGRDSVGNPIRGGADIRVGDLVEVFRAGDVIPKIGQVDLAKRPQTSVPFVFPTCCPSCGGTLLAEAVEVRCVQGPACPPQRLYAFVHALGRDALDADGVSEAALSQWIEWGWVRSLADVLDLEANHGPGSFDPLSERLGWGEVSAARAFGALRQARTTTLDRALYALGISLVGRATARDLAGVFAHWGDLVADALAGGPRMSTVPGVGPKAVAAMEAFWSNPDTHDRAMDVLAMLDISNPLFRASSQNQTSAPFSGWTVVFTGTFPGTPREVVAAQARDLGANVAGSVSQKTDVVVAGEKAGTKKAKAQSLGVAVVDPEEWLGLVAQALAGETPPKPAAR